MSEIPMTPEQSLTSKGREEELRALLVRVEAATGADKGLSVAIWYALYPDRERLWAWSGLNAQRDPGQNTEGDLRKCVLRDPKEYGWDDEDHYTASLDAALGLVERVLLGAEFEITNLYDTPMAKLPLNGGDDQPYEACRLPHGTLALAVVGALLKALSHQTQVQEG